MTLNTDIYILDPVDPHEVFNFGNTLLGNPDNVYQGPEGGESGSVKYSERVGGDWNPEGVVNLHNRLGQGFPAILDCDYRAGEALWVEDKYEIEDLTEYGGDIDTYLLSPACYMSLSFDTSYGYKDEHGGATVLHARYIVALYHWLQEKNVRMRWKNEYNSQMNDGIDGLLEFFSAGDKASDWFQNEVLPLISIGMPNRKDTEKE